MWLARIGRFEGGGLVGTGRPASLDAILKSFYFETFGEELEGIDLTITVAALTVSITKGAIGINGVPVATDLTECCPNCPRTGKVATAKAEAEKAKAAEREAKFAERKAARLAAKAAAAKDATTK